MLSQPPCISAVLQCAFFEKATCLPKGFLRALSLPTSLFCSCLFVIPSQFLGQVIRTWTPDNSLQAGKVVIAPAVSNTQGFLPRSGGQVAYSCFLFHSLANCFNLFHSCSLSFAKSVALTVQSKGYGESFPAVSESGVLGGVSLRRSNRFLFHIC